MESIILLDVPSGEGAFESRLLEGMGHRVVVCNGPEHAGECPILVDGTCTKVDNAHGIVYEFDLDRADHRAILQKYQEVVNPGIPIRVVVAEGQETKYASLLEGVEVWSHSPSAGDVDAFSAHVEGYERTATPES